MSKYLHKGFYRKRPIKVSFDGSEFTDFDIDLGKIADADFNLQRDFLLGLSLRFSLNGGHVGCFYSWSNNMSDLCEWEYKNQRLEYSDDILQIIRDIFEDAKVESISALVGTPVEVYSKYSFMGFRVLKEVL